MSKKKITVDVHYQVTMEVDTDDDIVKEYESQNELVSDLVHYRFSTLPVLQKGVKINDIEVSKWTYA
jgi:hypothetical protein